MPLQSFEMPTFTETENVFLRHYAQTRDRAQSAVDSGLAQEAAIAPTDIARLDLLAAQVIRKAEIMPLGLLLSALGADRIALLATIWYVCQHGGPREQSKALLLMAKIHGLIGEKDAGKTPVNLILHQPTPPASPTPPGLPFTLDITTSDVQSKT